MTYQQRHPSTTFQVVYNAKSLLNVCDLIRPTKEEIQKAFLIAAKKYHPDGRHHFDSQPCAVQFRQCVQARDLLLHHYHGPSPRYTDSVASAFRQNHAASANHHGHDRFAKGFPFQTLRLLTLKQKLAIRGTIMMLVCAGAGYDKWVRVENQRLRAQASGISATKQM